MEESINKQLSRLLGEIKKGHAKALGGIQLGKEGHVQFARERRIYRKLSFDKKSI